MIARHNFAAAVLAGAGLLLFLLAAVTDPGAALRGWLAAAVGWAAVSLGCLLVLLVRRLTDADRPDGLGAGLAAAAGTLPLVGLAFVPVLVGLGVLYPWVADPPTDAFKAVWLTPGVFVGRSIAYFLLWVAVAELARRRAGRLATVVGLMLVVLTGSLASVDWLMSLEPSFHSSIFGSLFLSHAVLAGWGVVVAATFLLGGPADSESAGGFLIAGISLWAYMAFCQYLVVWNGNQPEEIGWYLRRESPFWGTVYWASSALEGVLPFLLLLPRSIRGERRAVGLIGALVVVGGMLEIAVMALPPFGDGIAPALAALAAMVGLGGLWVLVFGRRLEVAHG